jgi:hypothetical protein
MKLLADYGIESSPPIIPKAASLSHESLSLFQAEDVAVLTVHSASSDDSDNDFYS